MIPTAAEVRYHHSAQTFVTMPWRQGRQPDGEPAAFGRSPSQVIGTRQSAESFIASPLDPPQGGRAGTGVVCGSSFRGVPVKIMAAVQSDLQVFEFPQLTPAFAK
jgi:hypothetical protein